MYDELPPVTGLHTPDYHTPDTSPTPLQSFNLTEPGINYMHGSIYAPDPTLPDLTSYPAPCNLDMQNNTTITSTPDYTDLSPLELPDSMSIYHHSDQPDPLLPDLQQPQLTQDTHMTTRPGDLAPDALNVMHQQLTYQQLDDIPYTQVFSDQSGMNSTRRRHFDLLMHGLDDNNGQ